MATEIAQVAEDNAKLAMQKADYLKVKDVLCCTLLSYCVVLCCTVLYCVVLCCTVSYMRVIRSLSSSHPTHLLSLYLPHPSSLIPSAPPSAPSPTLSKAKSEV